MLEGLVGVIAVQMGQPTFDGQTKRRLDSPLVADLTADIIGTELSATLDADPELAASIAARATAAARARMAARLAPRSAVVKARDLVVDYKVYQEQFGDGAIEAHCSDGVILANGHPCRPSSPRTPTDGQFRVPVASEPRESVAEVPAELRTVLTA